MISVLELVTAPGAEPISYDQAAAHLRLDLVDTATVEMYISAARAWCEDYLGRVLVTQQLRWTVASSQPPGNWPLVGLSSQLLILPQWLNPSQVGLRPLSLPRQPVQSVDGIVLGRWLQTDVTLDPSLYGVNTAIGEVQMFGPLALGLDGRLSITFTAGYGDTGDAVPFPIRQAILLMTAFFYENRGDAVAEPPPAAKALLSSYRQVTFG